MKLVREHIEQFTRGKNPFKSLNIGKRGQIENWFKDWAPNVDYEIDDDLNIRVKESLDIQNINATSLPDNLYVEGWLDIRDTNITSLPDNLYVKGWLNTRWTKITSLPDDLHVGENLYISKVISLPNNLYVGGKTFRN